MNYLKYLFLLLSSIVAISYMMGVLYFLSDYEPKDKCEMTYMFEYPQYVRVSQKIDQKYSKYGLYAYGEGRTTKKARNMYFDGIPVLFIPGNAGSHQQVRSLSSVALRKALNSGSSYHFDYFTVDLNSEISALYGPVLYEQLEYVLSSIRRILELYRKDPRSPKQVVLIGHSIGGIVARKVVSQLSRNNENLASLLINLAAPVKRAPIYFDRRVSDFYKSSSDVLENITVISISGGYSDFLVPSYLTKTEGNYSVNLVSTNIPKAWVESNHVQILWCKQIVLAINRALFDSVDTKIGQISEDKEYVKKVFEHHLLHNSGTKHHLRTTFEKQTKINYKGEWFETLYKQYSIEHKNGVRHPQWYMVAFTTLPNYEILTVLAINLEVHKWIFACNAALPNGGSRVCVEGDHLTQFSEIIPTVRFKRRLVTINMQELHKNKTEYSHVVFRALPTSEPVTFHVDIHGLSERQTTVSLPKFSLYRKVILAQTPEKALVYDLIIPELTSILQVYQLFVEPIHCSLKKHHSTASLILPWSNEQIHKHFTESVKTPFVVRLQNSKPQNADDAKIRLILEPSCTYKVSSRMDILGMLSQIARYYSTFLITISALVFLLGFQNQLYHLSETGSVPIFFSSILNGLKQGWIILVVILLSEISRTSLNKTSLQLEFINIPNEGFSLMAFLILFMTSFVVVFILVAAYCISLFALESTVHKLTLKMLARSVTLTIRFSDYFMTFLQKMPFIVAVILIFLCFATCGGLALCVGIVFYFLKLTQMSQDYVEQLTWYILKYLAKKFKNIFKKNKKGSNKEETQNDGHINISGSTNQIDKSEASDKIHDKSKNKTHNKCEETNHDLQLKETIQDNPADASNCAQTGSDQPEKENRNLIENLSSTNNTIFFHSSMFFIWVIVTILNIPAVLTWAHNFKFSKHLIPDESFLPGLVLSLSALPLWQFDFPRTDRKYLCHLRVITLCIIVVSLSFATVSVYRLNYMLSLLFALVVIQQCYAPKISEINDPSDSPNEKGEHYYDEIKRKID